MKLFQKYKTNKAVKMKARNDRLERSEKEAELKLAVATREMLARPCAINDMNLCKSMCVHWLDGCVSFYPGWEDFDDHYYYVRPKCRLWR